MTSYQTRNKRIGLDERISNFVAASVECGFAGRDSLTRKELYAVCEKTGIVYPRWLAKNADRRLGRGMYSFPELASAGVTQMDVDDDTISLSTAENVSPGHGTEGDELNDNFDQPGKPGLIDDEIETQEAVCQTTQ
tara:strand:+ start:1105 stop:1512 length:408 start_codon:yes stop_codon:yes gene_type:complete